MRYYRDMPLSFGTQKGRLFFGAAVAGSSWTSCAPPDVSAPSVYCGKVVVASRRRHSFAVQSEMPGIGAVSVKV
jgi:hypothetical protein